MIGLHHWNISPIGGLTSLWLHGFPIFQSRILKWLLSNSEAVNTREDKKRIKTVPVLKWFLEKFDK